MKQQKRRRTKRRDTLVLKLMILVALVLVIFEGRLVVTMITHRSVMNAQTTVSNETEAKEPVDATLTDPETKETEKPVTSAPGVSTLAGMSTGTTQSVSNDTQTQAASHPTVSDPDSPAIVQKTTTPVDDSYFADAAFIGDSRMEGFRNTSGITQGRFFTSVGMSTSKMAKDAIIATEEGNITVAAALSGGSYNKIYIMLGANDLGEYDWNSFHDRFVSATRRFRELQPNAIIYVCSCIYVEESKVSTSYVNNENVDTLNSILLQICEEENYYYLDLNEFLSDGYGSLIQDASSDGVHIYEKYCKLMLEYLKNHYVEVPETSSDEAAETEAETSTDSGAL